MYFEVIYKYFFWPFQLNYQIKDRKSAISNIIVFQCFFLHLEIFIFVALEIKGDNDMAQCA